MVVKKKIRPSGEVREYLLANIGEHPNDIVGITAKRYAISPVAVQKHLRQLVSEGRVIKEGRTRSTKWLLAPQNTGEVRLKVTPYLREHEVWESTIEPKLGKNLPGNVREIVQYGFTEMLNNVVDHSEANNTAIKVSAHGDLLSVSISDDGVGIFRKIQKAFGLEDPRESILELAKGKVTTDPSRHSGEGIFFTSRAFDKFELSAGSLVFIKDNLQDDWLIDTREDDSKPGTNVTLEIRKNAPTILRQIFDEYTDPETQRFDRTHIVVELAKKSETEYISRSQAKRILSGLEKFRHVVLDFRNVRTVGQAFVDEIFRVFRDAHPEIQFESINANENVDFMIRRGIATGSGKKT